MAKKNKNSFSNNDSNTLDIVEEFDLPEEENTKMEEVKVPEVVEIKMDFEQAFRIFQKNTLKAKSWNPNAVLVFSLKKDKEKLKTLEKWNLIFEQY